jgi:DNA-binding transcriptional MerR regulator
MSGVSVRTLHFYDEKRLLKPAYLGANGYRYYEEPQLLTLQQILFFRELGFELKEIKRILGRADFETVAALEAHRQVLRENVNRTQRLILTIDKTIQHLKGNQPMHGAEMFEGFSVAAGHDRFGERVKLGTEPNDCKVSGRDTGGAMCVFEFSGSTGGPRHSHVEQDEWIYVLDGELDFELGAKRMRLAAGESVFIPRRTAHAWAAANGTPAKIMNVYQPAGRLEDFFRALATSTDLPTAEEAKKHIVTAKQKAAVGRLFRAHGMEMLGPPLGWDT